jgi:N-acetylmuramoyl-L-alanine amidase
MMKTKLLNTINACKKKLMAVDWKKKVVSTLVVSALFVGFTFTAHAASYTVQPGDTLWLIGQRFGVTVNEIKQASGIWYDLLYPGDVLTIPDESPAPATRATSVTSRGGIRPSSEDVRLLAQMIMAEAEGEPYEGKVAVGAVILNRLEDPAFPKTLTGVLYETDAFEPILNGSFYAQGPDQQCIQAATDALSGVDPTGGALYFYNPSTAWSPWVFTRPIVTQIGNHVFAK